MKDFIKQMTDAEFEIYFELCIVPYIERNREKFIGDLNKNLCLEHYNMLNKTNFTENDIELNPSECWVCKEKSRH